jgi:hypothetical protein
VARRIGTVQGHRHHIVAHLSLELLGGAVGHDPAALDDRQPVAEVVRLLQVLRGQNTAAPPASIRRT